MNWSHASTIKQHAASLCNIQMTQENLNRRDLLFFFNECYNNLYRRICRKDKGFYARREKLETLRKYVLNPIEQISGSSSIQLPDYVLEVVGVYEAQEEFAANRVEYQNADNWSRVGSSRVYVLEGRQLFVDASMARAPIWVEFIPAPAVITWTIKNHEPDILDETDEDGNIIIPQQPDGDTIGYRRIDKNLVVTDLRPGNSPIDMKIYYEDELWEVKNFLISDPYLVINYANRILPSKHQIRIYSQPEQDFSVKGDVWNAFDWKGRPTNCEALYAVHNDFTLGDMVVKDHDDGGKIKRLGFFPDSKISYPNSITCDLLTYMLADRISKISNIDSPLIIDGLADSWERFEEYTKVNRAAFHRIEVMRPFSAWM